MPSTVLRTGQTVELRGRFTKTLHLRILSVGAFISRSGKSIKLMLKTPTLLVTPWTSVCTRFNSILQFRFTVTPASLGDPGAQFPVGVQHITPVKTRCLFGRRQEESRGGEPPQSRLGIALLLHVFFF